MRGRRHGIGNRHRGSGAVVHYLQMTIDELITAARSGSARAAGRLLSMVESSRRDEVLDALGPTTPPRILGVTGPPGAGKSTTVAALVSVYRERAMRVAVLAVDPSSPYSGGALHGGLARGTVPVQRQAGHRGQPRRDRGMTCNDATAVEALAEDDVVDRAPVEISDRAAHHVLGKLIGIGVPQRALHRCADRSAQGGHDHGF